MKFLDELLIDLQVFAQKLLREHLTMKFSRNISLLLFEVKHTYIYASRAFLKWFEEMCLFKKIFLKVIDYTIIFLKGHDF